MRHVWIPRFESRDLNSLKTGELQGFSRALITAGRVVRETAQKYKTYVGGIRGRLEEAGNFLQ
jgi:hypothetical protein